MLALIYKIIYWNMSNSNDIILSCKKCREENQNLRLLGNHKACKHLVATLAHKVANKENPNGREVNERFIKELGEYMEKNDSLNDLLDNNKTNQLVSKQKFRQ